MSGFVWEAAPSPQRGEGVWSCSTWAAMPVRTVSSVFPSGIAGRATRYQTTLLPRPTPSSPRPFGERARVRGKIFKATQESEE
jgi:hypothetical protein